MKKIALFLPIFLFANIDKIEFDGLLHLSPLTAKSIIDIKEGDKFDIEKVDKSIKELYETGYFKNIEVIKDKNRLIFKCVEKPVISKIEFENFSDNLKKALKSENLIPKKGEVYKKENIDKLIEFIKGFYLSQGYFNTQVYVKKEFLSPFQIKLSLKVYEGDKIAIRRVNFYGAKFSKSKLLNEIENEEKTPFSFLPFFNSGELNLYQLFQDKQKLQDYYLNLGYIDAKVSDPLAKINFDSNFADIDYKIKEGNRYIVSDVKINYPKNIKVKSYEFNLKKGKYFNVSALRKDINAIKELFANEGYAFCKVYPQIIKHKNQVEVIYQVEPGNIYYIRNVIIEGNSKTLDRVVRRDVYLAPGDKFSLRDLKDSKNTLQRRGYFERVDIQKRRVGNHQLDLIVKVKEGLTGSLRGGISYGSYSGLGVNLAISEKNIFGSGQRLKFSVDYTNKSSTYLFSLYNPRVLDSRYYSDISIYKSSFVGVSYTTKKRGFKVGAGRSLTRFLSLGFSYELSKIALSNYSSTLDVRDKTLKSALTTSLNYDDTDRYFFPTKGKKAGVSLEFAGIGGDEKYLKLTSSFKYFYPLIDKVYKTYAVLKYRVIAGAISNRGYLPLDEKFYLGGVGSVRGFSYYTISPTDKNDNYIGGKYEFITGPEISTPLSIKNRLWMSGFLDYGVVGENSLNISRASYGVSIDWITPVGPLKFVWAWPIKYKKGDDLRRFEFTIGTGF